MLSVVAEERLSRIQIIDLNGRIVSDSRPNDRRALVDMNAQAKGMYLVKAESVSGRVTTSNIVLGE